MTDTVGVLTAEDLAILPERMRDWYRCAHLQLSFSPPANPYPAKMVVELCYELAQAKLEIRRLRDDSR